VELNAFCRDSLGVAVAADSARLFVYRDTTLVQSSQTIANSKIKLGQTRRIKAKYTIPVATPDSARFSFYVRAKADGILDYYPCTPATVLVHDGTVDSLSPASVVDLYAQQTSIEWGVVTSTDGGKVTQSGTDLTGATVLISPAANLSTITASGQSTAGNYYIPVRLDPTKADTMYVSAWYQGDWVKSYTRVIK
jgi:hypothetical protein